MKGRLKQGGLSAMNFLNLKTLFLRYVGTFDVFIFFAHGILLLINYLNSQGFNIGQNVMYEM